MSFYLRAKVASLTIVPELLSRARKWIARETGVRERVAGGSEPMRFFGAYKSH